VTNTTLPLNKPPEKLIEERRNQILDAAARLFARKRYRGATIREIAREAGAAEGSIYNYFDSKATC